MIRNHPIVGLLSAYIPRELPYALGCTPVRVFPSAAKPTAAEAYLPRNFCTLNRLILASFLEDEASKLDAVIFADEDDSTRRLHDVWRTSVPVPVWSFVEVPRLASSFAVDRYTKILGRTSEELERHTRRTLSATALRQSLAVYNEQRNLLDELKHHWRSGGIDTITYRRLRRMALNRDPVATNSRLDQTLEGIDKDQTDPSTPMRLLLLSELVAPAGLVRLVEIHGARIVAEVGDIDELDLAAPVRADADTVDGLLGALAEAYLSKPPGPRMRDLSRRLAHLTHLVERHGVQAAICAYSKFCDLYLAEFPTLKAHLEGLGVPVLLLELEDDAISGQHRTRVEAFLEMTKA